MLLREFRRKSCVSVSMLMLVALINPFTGYAQSIPNSAANRQQQIVATIEREQSRNGVHAEELLAPLTALSLFYQEQGDLELAAGAIDRARQVVRVNHGLNSMEEAMLMRLAMHIEEARGNAKAAWDIELELQSLARRHRDDIRTVPIFREIADKRMNLLTDYIDGEFPPQFFFGCFYDRRPSDGKPGCRSGRRSVAIRSILLQAHRNYLDAIGVLNRHALHASEEIRDIEKELIQSSFQYDELEYPVRRGYGYRIGRDSLRRLVSYEVSASAPAIDQINSLIQVADWDLFYSLNLNLNDSTLDIYLQAYDQLKRDGVAQSTIDRIFAPEIPVVLPAFLDNPLLTIESPDSTGYIDVSFDVTKYGRSRKVKILDATSDVSVSAARELVQTIKRSRFRPRIIDNRIADTSPIVVRYYLND